ncbi:MAG TPA: ABC transporter permease, partial [Steroidobacteraceae bacterium]|nr:ABC transporter permease [Steroidobacteraceae bacterium]
MLKHYLITAFRNLRRHSVTTSVNVVGLALGLACFIGALSAVKYYALDDSQYAGSDRTYIVKTEYAEMGTQGNLANGVLTPLVLAPNLSVQFPNDGVSQITSASTLTVTHDGNPFDLRASYADAEFLKMFPIPFVVGNNRKALTEPHTAVISEIAAQRIFGRRDVIGRTLLLDGKEAVNIVGVHSAPSQPSHIGSSRTFPSLRFEMLVSMDVLRAMMTHRRKPEEIETIYSDWSPRADVPAPFTYIRLASSGQRSLDLLNQTLASQSKLHPHAFGRRFVAHRLSAVRAQSQTNSIAGTGLAWSSFVILAAGIVLLASCLNYANLSAAVLLSHCKEIGVRRVLGASTRQLAAHSIVESSLVTACAFVVAVSALLAIRPVVRSEFEIDLVYAWSHSIGMWMTALGVLLFVVCAIAAYCIWITRRSKVESALRQSRGEATSKSDARWLVTAQFLLASILVVSTLMVRAQHEAMRQFALDSLPDPIVTIDNNLQTAGVTFDSLRSELSKQPGVLSVGGSAFGPWGQSYGLSLVAGSLESGASEVSVMALGVTDNYFSTMDVRTLAGQQFAPSTNAPPNSRDVQVVVDRSTARQLGFADPNNAVGKVFYPGASIKQARQLGVSFHIRGVVEDKPWQFSVSGAAGVVFLRSSAPTLTPIVRLSKSQVPEALAAINAVWKQMSPNRVLRHSFLDERIEQFIA